jgi:hypothetical protein
VNEQVEAAAEGVDGRREVETVRFVGDVARNRMDGRSAAEIGGGITQLAFPACVDDQLPAVGGERTGECEAEPS